MRQWESPPRGNCAGCQALSYGGGGVHFYNGASVWSQNQREFDDAKGVMELEIMGRKIAYLTKALRRGAERLAGAVEPVNYAGFRSIDHMEASYQEIGL